MSYSQYCSTDLATSAKHVPCFSENFQLRSKKGFLGDLEGLHYTRVPIKDVDIDVLQQNVLADCL